MPAQNRLVGCCTAAHKGIAPRTALALVGEADLVDHNDMRRSFWVHHGKTRNSHAAHRMAYYRGFLNAKFVEQRLHIGGDHIEIVGEYWLRAFAIANTINGDHAETSLGQRINREGVGF